MSKLDSIACTATFGVTGDTLTPGDVQQTHTMAHKWTKTTGVDEVTTGTTTQVSITHMHQYSDSSFEELRVQDHETDRKKMSGAPGLTTVQPGAFGVAGTLVCIVYVCVLQTFFHKTHSKVLFTRLT